MKTIPISHTSHCSRVSFISKKYLNYTMKFDFSKIKFSSADIKKNLYIPEKLSDELAEETGLHIGDGSMNFYNNKNNFKGMYSLRGHIFDDVDHYKKRISKLYKEIYSFVPNLLSMKSTGVFGFQVWSDCIVTFKNEVLGLPLGNKINIKIPKILLNDKDYFISVIRGIFDTDGCIYLEKKNNKLYPRIQIATISSILAEQMVNNLIRIGFRATKHVENRESMGWNNL